MKNKAGKCASHDFSVNEDGNLNVTTRSYQGWWDGYEKDYGVLTNCSQGGTNWTCKYEEDWEWRDRKQLCKDIKEPEYK